LDLNRAREVLQSEGLDGWLIYDFRGSNPNVSLIAGGKPWTTRRLFLWIPAEGEQLLIVNRLDLPHTAALPGTRLVYTDRLELAKLLDKRILLAGRRLAMEYSPEGALPVVSTVDGGMIDLVRSRGVEVVSSADLTQMLLSKWSDAALHNHLRASAIVAKIKDEAFALIGKRLRSSENPHEYEIQQFILQRFGEEGLETDEEPVVATNERSGDPHYLPTKERSAVIRSGDWILIDLWARIPGEENVFSDITWVGVAGREPTPREELVFATVKAGRDRAISFIQETTKEGIGPAGWEVDAAVRKVIGDAGFGGAFFHRTGHSLSPGRFVHGTGVNIDDYETHDTRRILPGLGFTVEPGIYLSDFGVRLEINALMTPQGVRITSCIQQEIVKI